MIARIRRAWDRYWSQFRGHRSHVGGLWFETMAGHWVQGLPLEALVSTRDTDFPGYIGVRISGELEVTSMPFDHGIVTLVREDHAEQVALANEAFESLLRAYLERQNRTATAPIPSARSVDDVIPSARIHR